MSIAAYAEQVITYLHDNGFEFAEPDPRGGTFPGGILMDLGGGQRVAFFLPTDDLDVAIRALRGYLDDVYPVGHDLSRLVRDGGLLSVYVYLNEAILAAAG